MLLKKCYTICLQADGKRSKTVILVKDLKAELSSDELKEIFGKHGTVDRVLLPPHGSTALVEFQEPSEAKKAFTKTAYRSVSLYLSFSAFHIILRLWPFFYFSFFFFFQFFSRSTRILQQP